MRQALLRDSRCLALAANAVINMHTEQLRGQTNTTQHKHRTQEAHEGEHKNTKQIEMRHHQNHMMVFKTDFRKRTNQKHTKCIYLYQMFNVYNVHRVYIYRD